MKLFRHYAALSLVLVMILQIGSMIYERPWVERLITACEDNDIDAVETMLESNWICNVNAEGRCPYVLRLFPDFLGENAMTVTLKNGNVDIEKMLLEHGASPNYTFPGNWSPLELAFSITPAENKYECANVLITYGARIENDKLNDAFTLIDCISEPVNVESEYIEKYELQNLELYKRLDRMAIRKCPHDSSDNNPLTKALYTGNIMIAEYLLALYPQKYDVNMQDYNGETGLISLIKYNQEPSQFDEHIADTVRYIIIHGGDVSIKDEDGFTALDYARKKGCQEIIELLE